MDFFFKGVCKVFSLFETWKSVKYVKRNDNNPVYFLTVSKTAQTLNTRANFIKTKERDMISAFHTLSSTELRLILFQLILFPLC